MRSLVRKAKLYLSMLRYGNAHNCDFAREHFLFFEKLKNYLGEHGSDNLEELRVLDFGCGKTYWMALLLRNCGAQVTGIDAEHVEPGMSLKKYIGILKRNGAERAMRTLGWDLLYRRQYYRELNRISGMDLQHTDIEFRCARMKHLDLAADTFDLVVSHEVFEHLRDVPGTLNELHRVMKPESLAFIYVHNFTSLSGGHHIAWKYPDTEPSKEVPAWNHLRQNSSSDIPSWINGMREHEYRKCFSTKFDIIDWLPGSREGEALLTDDLRRELSEYSSDELLTKGFTVVAQPKGLRTN